MPDHRHRGDRSFFTASYTTELNVTVIYTPGISSSGEWLSGHAEPLDEMR